MLHTRKEEHRRKLSRSFGKTDGDGERGLVAIQPTNGGISERIRRTKRVRTKNSSLTESNFQLLGCSLLDYVLNSSFPQICADVSYFWWICQYLDWFLLPIHNLGIKHLVHFLHTFSFIFLHFIHKLAHEAFSNLIDKLLQQNTKLTNIKECFMLRDSISVYCLKTHTHDHLSSG